MSIRHLLAVITVWLAALPVKAQQDPAFAQYWAAQSFYNPASMSLDGMLAIRMAYSMQMSGFEHAPATMVASVDLPLFFISDAHSAGVMFLNDKLGLFTHMKIAAAYAYHQKFGKGLVSGGIRFGLVSEGFDGSKLDLIDSGDPAFPTSDAKGSGFDLDFGLRFDYGKRWYAGAAMHHITAPVVALGQDKQYEYNVASSFCVTGGWNTALHDRHYRLYTDAILRSDLLAWRGDVAARMQYESEKLNMYAGVGYSPMNSVSLLVGTVFHGLEIGYAYEAYTSSIGMLHGNHELTLCYKMDMSRFKKGRNLHKSVRLL